MELTPPKGKLIIKKDEPKARTSAGIHLGKNDRLPSLTGIIFAANDECGYIPGQQVVFESRVSNSFSFRDENLIMVSEDSILALI